MDPDGKWTPLNSGIVNTYITAQINSGDAYQTTVERWDPWSELSLPLGITAASQYNYARMTVNGKSWYAFVSARYLNRTTTVFDVTPDDCVTYSYSIGYSHWNFGHVAVAASQSDTYGTQYCDAPEPLELTPEYGALAASLTAPALSTMKAIIVSSNQLGALPFTVSPFQTQLEQGATLMDEPLIVNEIFDGGTPNPVLYPNPEMWWQNSSGTFFYPSVFGAPANTINGVAQAGGVWVLTMAGLRRYLSIMGSAPWVLQGISKIMLVPSWAVAGGGTSSSTASAPQITDPSSDLWEEARDIVQSSVGNITINTTSQTLLSGWRNTIRGDYDAGIYRKLTTSAAGCSVVLSDGVDQVQLKPEAWLTAGFGVQQSADIYQGIVRCIPVGYGGLIGGEMGLTLEMGGSVTPGKVGIGLAHQHGSLDDQQGPYQLRRGVLLAIINAMISQNVSVTVADLQAGLQQATGIIGSASSAAAGDFAGALTGGLTSSMNSQTSMQISGLTNEQAYRQTMDSLQYSLAQNLPKAAWRNADKRAVSGQGGRTDVSGSWRRDGLGRGARIVVMMPTAGRVRTLISQWNRRGYAIDRAFVPPRLDPMTSRSYWQGQDVVVIADAPADAKARIARRFEAGTTIVNSVAAIGTNSTNNPRTGVSY